MEHDFYTTYFEVERTHWLMKGRRSVIYDLLSRYAPAYMLHKQGRLLDLGCGSGFLVGELQRRGYLESYGADSEPDAIAFGLAQGIRHLSTEPIEKTSFPDASFDVILCMDVLEHLPDDTKGIVEIERLLKPGGVCIFTVPAYQFLWGIQDEVAHHFRRYTKSSLQKAIGAGPQLRELRSSYFNTALFPLVALVRLLTRFGLLRSRESDFDINTALLNAIFSWVFSVERVVLRMIPFPYGVSLFVVCQKSR